ncbi:hypothetical protein V2J09_020423 [Rumex salicifolius]
MDSEVDHYRILGLPSGEEGAKLTQSQINKAYRDKARVVHPDKRRDDPDAHENFLKLTSSHEILKDEKARKLFDDLLRVKREKQVCETHYEAKQRKMVSELEKRERYTFDPEYRERGEEERIKKKLQEEIARIRAMHANKGASAYSEVKSEKMGKRKEDVGSGGRTELDKEKVLNVSWEKVGAERLREIFGKFGEVEDVVIRISKKKKGKAIALFRLFMLRKVESRILRAMIEFGPWAEYFIRMVIWAMDRAHMSQAVLTNRQMEVDLKGVGSALCGRSRSLAMDTWRQWRTQT